MPVESADAAQLRGIIRGRCAAITQKAFADTTAVDAASAYTIYARIHACLSIEKAESW